MNMETIRQKWKCPVCGGALLPYPEKNAFSCDARHSFDVARQGYVNLLLPQKRGASLPGDDKNMVAARSAFLEKGYYEGFSDGVDRAVMTACTAAGKRAVRLADAGCGEGYYTVRLVRELAENGYDVSSAGFDLSKDAVRRGAVKAREAGLSENIRFAVASLFEMPVADGSLDGIVNLFAPTSDEEFARVLCPGGFLLLAVPGEEHLFGLKQALYDSPYKNEIRRDDLPHFDLENVTRVSYEITLSSNEDIRNLFAMTPYFWRTSQKDTEKLSGLSSLTTPVSFDLLLYRKKE